MPLLKHPLIPVAGGTREPGEFLRLAPGDSMHPVRSLHARLACSVRLRATDFRGRSGDGINVDLRRTDRGPDQRFRIQRHRPGHQLRHIVQTIT